MNTAKKLMMMMRSSGTAAPAFSPLDIAGLVLWLDASDSTTLFQDDAGTTPATAADAVIGRWEDKSGNGKHVTQASAPLKPLLKLAQYNARAALKFDVSELKNAAIVVSQPDTVFAVVDFDVIVDNTYEFIMDGNVGGRQSIGKLNTGPWYIATDTGISAGTATGGLKLLVTVFDGASSSMTVNGAGVLSGDAGTQALNTLIMGRTYQALAPLEGYCAEFLIYSGLLTAPQVASIVDYLNAKWAVY